MNYPASHVNIYYAIGRHPRGVGYPSHSRPRVSNDNAFGESLFRTLKFVTPTQQHRGQDVQILADRKAIYERAKAKNPLRWSSNTRNREHQTTMTLKPVKEV